MLIPIKPFISKVNTYFHPATARAGGAAPAADVVHFTQMEGTESDRVSERS